MTLPALLDAAQVVAAATEPTASWISSPAGIAIITAVASLLSLWVGSRLRLGEAAQAGRLAAEEAAAAQRVAAEQAAVEAADARRQQEHRELVEARREELRILREVRGELRKGQDELRARVEVLESELEDARQERLRHGEERLEWFGERDRLQRQIADAHEVLAATRADLELVTEELRNAREELELTRAERERAEADRARLAERLESLEVLLAELKKRTQHTAFDWQEQEGSEPQAGEGG